MRIRSATTFLAACVLTAAASAQSPHRPAGTSWGKPGVSLEEYAVDGGLCAYHAMNLDVSDSDAARRLVIASRALEAIEARWGLDHGSPQALSHARMVQSVRPERQFEAVAELQQSALDACLIERGYRRFRLTDDQVRQLRRLRRGSPERRAYLHRLGSDPQVLERQGLPAGLVSPPQG